MKFNPNLFLLDSSVGLLAAIIAHNAGVPWWRTGWGIGDATDIGVLSAIAVGQLMQVLRGKEL